LFAATTRPLPPVASQFQSSLKRSARAYFLSQIQTVGDRLSYALFEKGVTDGFAD
jgi:hypothetical protein